jgi:uncharacterized protein (AIM24 family)
MRGDHARPQETVIAEAGTMMMMDEGIEMKTIFGDGDGQEQSFMDKMLGRRQTRAHRRKPVHDHVHEQSSVRRTVWFAAAYPGKIMPAGSARLQRQV